MRFFLLSEVTGQGIASQGIHRVLTEALLPGHNCYAMHTLPNSLVPFPVQWTL
jgi:hypothetical protein